MRTGPVGGSGDEGRQGMTEQGGWTAPEGWGPPPSSAATPPPGGYGAPPSTPYGQPVAKPGVVPLRPLGLGELLDGAVGVLRRYPRPTLGLSALVALVTTLVNVLLLTTAFRPLLDPDAAAGLSTGDPAALEAALGGAAVGGLLTFVLTLLSTAVLTGVLTSVVGRAVLGQPLSLGEAWAQVRPLLLKLVGVALLIGILAGAVVLAGIVLGAICIGVGGGAGAVLGVPLILAGFAGGLWTYVRLSLAPCVLVLERTGVRDSLRRSAVLVKRDWWRVFGITVLTYLVAVFVSLVLQVPFELLGAGGLGDLTSGADALSARTLVFSSVGSVLVATVVDPFVSGVRALLYVDRRMRAEGLDVALSAAAHER